VIRPTKKLHYWDSCVFLAFLKNEKDKINDCISVLKAAENGQVILEKGQPKLPKESEEKIRDFFRHEWIYIYDVDRKVGELARELMWQYQALKPKDATHVATAIKARVDVLDTFDDGLLKLSGEIGDPPLIIRKPFFEVQLDLF